MKNLILVFIGGGIGSCLRYLMALWLNRPESTFPMGTFAANVLSCLVLGFTSILVLNQFKFSEEIRLMIMVGLCGGFSTFSTFDKELLSLFRAGDISSAFFYAITSICIGIGGLLMGIKIAQMLVSK